MKKLIAIGALGLTLLTTSPAFAYEVKSGDTMGKIATAQGLNLQELGALNPDVSNLNLIYVGQTINTGDKTNYKHEEPVTQSIAVAPAYTGGVSAYERDLLARLVRAEAQSEPFAGKVAVADVVLNRVQSGSFPNSISAVINQSGQFSPVSSGIINAPADADSKRAVDQALSQGRSGSLFFYNPATASSRWLDSRPTVKVIGNHVFKR